MIVLQIAANEQLMVAVAGEAVIQFNDVGIELRGSGSGKSVSPKVQTITKQI